MRRRHAQGVFFRRLLSGYCVIVFLLAIGCTCIVLRFVSNNVAREIHHASQRAADVAVASINSCVQNTTIELSKLFGEPTIMALLKVETSPSPTLTPTNIYDISNSMKTLSHAKVSNKDVDAFFVFLPLHDCVVTYDLRYVFGSTVSGQILYNDGLEKLRSSFNALSTSGIYTLDGLEDSSGLYVAMIIRTYNDASHSEPFRLAICAELSYKEIQHLLEDAAIVAQTPFALTDETGSVILSTEGYRQDAVTNTQTVSSVLSDGKTCVVSYIPVAMLRERVCDAAVVPVLVSFLGLLMLFGVCYSFTNKLYKPIYNTLLYVNPQLQYERTKPFSSYTLPKSAQNEMLLIQSALQSARTSAERYSTLAFSRFMQSLCAGKYQNEDYLYEQLNSFGVSFEADYFEVNLLRIVHPHTAAMVQSPLTAAVRRCLADCLMPLCKAEMEGDGSHGFPCAFLTAILDDGILLLLNEHMPLETTLRTDLYVTVLEHLSIALGESVDFIIGCGDAHRGLLGICESYEGAKRALDQDIFCTDAKRIFFEMVNPGPGNTAYRMTRNDEQIITDALRRGNASAAVERMMRVIDQNAVSGSREHMELILSQLVTLPLRLLRESGYEPADVYGCADAVLFSDMRKPTKLILRREQLRGYYETAAQFFESMSRKNSLTVEAIENYIRSNYTRDLAAGEAADFFGISVSYFCVNLRRLTGKTFLDLLNGFRVQEAVHILIDTDIPLHEIAAKVGYLNYRTFARAFSRELSASPEEYRKKARAEKKMLIK